MRDRKNNAHNPSVIMSLPVYVRMMDPAMSINGTSFERIVVKLKNPESKQDIKSLIQQTK